MDNSLLEEEIENSIKILIPIFEISSEELKRFEKPRIIRNLSSTELPGISRHSSAYDFLRNLFYFPNEFPCHESTSRFKKQTINHEVGHYIHFQINKSPMIKYDELLRGEVNERIMGNWLELVAEYGNFIIGPQEYIDHYLVEFAYPQVKKIYDRFGSAFLPELARMSFEEVTSKGIIG